jgi:cycloeucalenol cycloisomerase
MKWLAADPAKAAAERFVLIYSPIWMVLVGAVMLGGLYRDWSDPGYMLFGVAAAAPLIVVPLLWPAPEDRQRRFWQTPWFRMNLWVAILVWFGSYFGSEYFFDVLGMRYEFPTRWNLDAALVGSGRDEVPLFLYPLTQAYFMTYHVGMTVLYRRLRTQWSLGWPARFALMFVLAYAVAFAETFFMAIPALRDVFSYPDRGRMLLVGSLFYASYFVISLPVFSQIDEDEAWTLGRTIGSALAVCMGVLIVLDGWALVFGSLME